MKKETTGIMQSYFNLNLLLSLTRMRKTAGLFLFQPLNLFLSFL